MKIYFIPYLIIFSCLGLKAQTAISGQLNLDSVTYQSKVILEKLNVQHIDNYNRAKTIAWSPLKRDGTFSFDKKHLSETDAVYRLYVSTMETALKAKTTIATTFIASKSDEIRFAKSKEPFAKYASTNRADKEWKKLQAFENELLHSQLTQEAGQSKYKSYAKDSLHILMVKLIGVKQLESKGLLEQDIEKNSDFYLAFLTDLKESEMPAKNYVFLENRLAFLTQDVLKEKYADSKAINYILGFAVLCLITYLVSKRRREAIVVPLSRQEQNIRNLIVQGKTNKEIANELFISISTVKTHITSIYSKLKVAGRQELLRKTQN